MQTILEKILAVKKKEITAAQKNISLAQLQEKIVQMDAPRDFVGALRQKINARKPAVIAEIKKASPSKGIIRENFDPIAIAKSYVQAGAACLSVLTDKEFFKGDLNYLKEIRIVCELPLLRKDFIIDPYQIYESRACGADAILLIVAALSDLDLLSLAEIAIELQLAILVEVHNTEELQRALVLSTPLIGINNRDLHSFKTDLKTTFNLCQEVPSDRIVITESGIHTVEDVAQMQKHGVNAFLIGESLMRAADPGKALEKLFMT